MNKRHLRIGLPAAAAIVIAIFLIARGGDSLRFLKPDPGFRDYITGYTSGVISTHAPIRIRLASVYADSAMIGTKADATLFRFSPSITGTAYWIDQRTVEFRPEQPLKENTLYNGTFLLSELRSVPEAYKEFVFQFHTMKQTYDVKLSPPLITEEDMEFLSVTGSVITADRAHPEKVQQMLEAGLKFSGKWVGVNIRWTDAVGGTRFGFVIDSLKRSDEPCELVVKHTGKPLGVKKQGEVKQFLPGRGEFAVLDVEVVHSPDQYLVITFSDLLNADMDFDGLVRFGGMRNLRFSVEGNRLKVYLPSGRSGEYTLVIESSVRSSSGQTLGSRYTRMVDLEALKPAVRLIGEGTILPSTNGLLFPFEAVNLNAVDVKIQKIYERNVPQFLQVNELSGSGEMYRVATTVYQGKVDLRQTNENVADFGQWNRYALELSKLMKPERGAIYRVILTFKRSYSTYPCASGQTDAQELTTIDPEPVADEDDGWSYMGDYDYDWYDYYDYDWSERNDPCSDSYYRFKSVARNILSSDLGIIAKAGSDGELICFTTDIITAEPLKDLEVEVMDFQMQILAKGRTDADGKVTFSLKKTPFLIVAKRADERGYLKLGEASTLSLSLFDVDGQAVRKGVKGFLYAERGVWRPGDTMFIHFILEDKLKQLPEDVPVIFELSDPRGTTVQRKVVTNSVKGMYAFHSTTHEEAVTGNYLGKVFIGNLVFSRYFKVETVKPNRLKIELKFENDRIMAGSDKPGILEARWLHGALAPGLRADVSMSMTSGKTRFDGFDGFNFDDPATSFYAETTVVFEDGLDAQGRAAIMPEIEMAEGAPGVLSATFVSKVFEPGGDFSINTVTLPYYPFTSYAGLWVPKGEGWWDMLETGKTHQFRLAHVAHTGKGIASSKLQVSIYKIDWRWWWHNSERGLPYFLSNTEATPVYSAQVNIQNGRGSFNWSAAENEWGRYLIRVTDPGSGHSTGKVVYMDQSGWGRRPGQMRDGASMLSVSADKAAYKVGEKAKITIPSPVGGRALVSIESGSRVLRTEWIRTDSGATHFTLDIKPEMAPNVYVHVLLLQPHRQTANDMPIRMYGVVPVMVEDPASRLNPVITMATSWEAESEVKITVSESRGKPMAYTLAIVDDGLLDLTGFKTPDPWKHFYGKEALGVRTWDLFSEVIGAYTAGFERLLSIGGGDTRINHDKQKARRFTPVVKSFGPMFLEPGKKQTHAFKMPQYVGSVRVMVIAAHEGAYGMAEQTATVKSPLMVLGTLPRVAGPGESIDLPVTVFAMDNAIKAVNVSVTTGGLFEVEGAASKSMNFRATGDQVINFKLKVKPQTGPASVTIVAVSGDKSARYTVNMDVRNPNPPETRVTEYTIAPGETWSGAVSLHGLPGTNLVQLELSAIPPLNLASRLDYLIRYPHGCLEQLMSAAFPQLMLKDVIYLDQRSQRETDTHIKAAIQALNRYSNSEGAFSYWAGGHYVNEWTNSYVGHFMIEAEKRGFVLPQGMKKRWVTSQRRLASNWKPSMVYVRDDLIQAYRLYTLALAGEPEIGAMNRLRSEPKLSLQARWRLASAYALAGRSKVANTLLEGAGIEVTTYREYGNTFGDPVRDRAMILEAMLLTGNTTRADQVAKNIIQSINSNQWYSTQTTSYALLALARYFKAVNPGEGLDCSYQINGKQTAVKSDKSLFTTEIPEKMLQQGQKVLVKNQGKGTLFVKVAVAGNPLPGDEQPVSRKLKMEVQYMLPDGKPLDPSRIKQGTDFMARITITSIIADPLQELALTHIVPSGWQIHNARLIEVEDTRTGRSDRLNHQDLRDDRVLTYFDLGILKSKTFTVMLNASFTGRFYLPAIRCETMYANDVFAQSAGRWVEVIK